jgi:PAS domain S-box-containing protein
MEIAKDNGTEASVTTPKSGSLLRRHGKDMVNLQTPFAGQIRGVHEMQRLVHELQVQQLELEMQNAELRQVRDDLEIALGNYTDLYEFAPVGYFTFDRNGIVHAANLTSAGMLGIERSQLVGRRFGQFVAVDGHKHFTEFLGRVFESQGVESCEVTLSKDVALPLILQIKAVVDASGQVCRAAIIDISVRSQ